MKNFRKSIFLIKLYEFSRANDGISISIKMIENYLGSNTPQPTVRSFCKILIRDGILIPCDVKYSFQRYKLDTRLLYDYIEKNEHFDEVRELLKSTFMVKYLKKHHIFY
jgi:hypothetical protein